MRVLVTGTAGFIGYHTTRALAERGDEVMGLDSINDYYDVSLKYARLAELGLQAGSGQKAAGPKHQEIPYGRTIQSSRYPNLRFLRAELEDRPALDRAFADFCPEAVCNLAAQAGVRYSLEEPMQYVHSNVEGFLNILECCRHGGVKNLSYASTSSVYGLNTAQPFDPSAGADHPVSLYAATKRANELMAHSYAGLFGIRTTGLRFFTVYGPWGRPDMALFLFTRAMLEGRPIQVFNHGKMKRDFTYIDDIVEGIIRVIDKPASPDSGWDPAAPDPASSSVPYRLYNIGNGSPVDLMDFIAAVEEELGIEAEKEFLPMQMGDVAETWADTSALERDMGYRPATGIREGVRRFVSWYRDYRKI